MGVLPGNVTRPNIQRLKNTDVLNQPVILTSKNTTYKQSIWKSGSFRNRENLQYKKTADSVLLSHTVSAHNTYNT